LLVFISDAVSEELVVYYFLPVNRTPYIVLLLLIVGVFSSVVVFFELEFVELLNHCLIVFATLLK